MNWWQALVTILLGNTIVLVPILLNSHPGTQYGIPFPVFARAAYGTVGSNLPALMRAVVACGWFGIQSWIGGEALHTFFASLVPGWPTLLGAGLRRPHHDRVALVPALLGPEHLHHLQGHGPAADGRELGRALRARDDGGAARVGGQKANGLGPLLSQPGKLNTLGEFLPVFVPSLTAMIGYWATLSLNMPDFTRFGRSQREQMVGQVVALPTTMTVFAAMGVLITSATVIIYGEAIWDPIKLVGPVPAAGRGGGLDVHRGRGHAGREHRRQRGLPRQRLRERLPAAHQFKTGGLITGILGILMQPWKLLADASGYIFTWLLGYSGGLGSIAGVLIADYWVVRRRQLRLEDLYLPDGVYRYRRAGTGARWWRRSSAAPSRGAGW